MRWIWKFSFLLVVVVGLVAGCKSVRGDKLEAVVETSMGEFGMTFYAEDAPNTVKNFVDLAEKGFYDGLVFHRVVKGFVIQGGDPRGNGTGGPGYTIAAEFNDRQHVEGTVAMARGPDINSAGSQFFICHGAPTNLDGQYSVFGEVIRGMEIVDEIAQTATDARDKPQSPVIMQLVRVVTLE